MDLNGTVGYDLGILVRTTMQEYNLSPDYGVRVDYWAKSMQMFVICDEQLT